MINEHEGHDHEHGEESFELDFSAHSQFVLELRQQNLDLLELAARVAGYGGNHGPLKAGDVKGAMKNIWDIYAEFQAWIEPEAGDEDEEGDEE